MIDVVLEFNGYDLSEKLSTYSVSYEVETTDTITTLDGTEHAVTRVRPQVRFRLVPMSDADTEEVYQALSAILAETVYTDPNAGTERTAVMRLASGLESAFGLRSIDGNRYYKGETITLRSRTVL